MYSKYSKSVPSTFHQKIRNSTGRLLSRKQWGGFVKLSNLQHFVTVNAAAAAAADGLKSCVIVHGNQMLQVGRSVGQCNF